MEAIWWGTLFMILIAANIWFIVRNRHVTEYVLEVNEKFQQQFNNTLREVRNELEKLKIEIMTLKAYYPRKAHNEKNHTKYASKDQEARSNP